MNTGIDSPVRIAKKEKLTIKCILPHYATNVKGWYMSIDTLINDMEAVNLEKDICFSALKNYKKANVIILLSNGNKLDLDILPNFPFSIYREIKIMLSDAVDQYDTLLMQIKNKNDEQTKH